MNETHEVRIAHLEKMVEAQVMLNTTLFKLILNNDKSLNAKVAEALRQLLVSPAVQLPPVLSLQITALRDALVLPIPQEVVEASRQPSIRPVE